MMRRNKLIDNFLFRSLCLVFFVVTLFLVSAKTNAQSAHAVTGQQVKLWIQQARQGGFSDNQIEELAKRGGWTDSDLLRLRQQLTSPLTVQPAVKRDSTVARRQNGEISRQPVAASIASPVFGASLFQNPSLTFEPNLRIPTPRNYVLGPDDELTIDIYGTAQHTYQARISPEGHIRLENLAPIYVNGLTIEQAKQLIVSRLRQVFAGLNTNRAGVYAQVALTGVRSIRVTLIGQAVRPGTYTLSSLATVYHALYAAGGPLPEQGSFRHIELYRNNRLIQQIDLYDFLLRADGSADVRLYDGDVIKINHYQSRVELAGAVKQPGIYEVKPGETFQAVLQFAGGFTDLAYKATIDLRRPTTTEYQIMALPADQLASFLPRSGDRYTVGSILNRYTNKVAIEGAVYRPGEYDLQTASTLRQLIQHAEGLREDAFLTQATIQRLNDQLEPELISVDLGKLWQDKTLDMKLRRDDRVRIYTVGELHENRTVSIGGAVNKAGRYPYVDKLTVTNLIALAGGFSDGASGARIEIARRIRHDSTMQPAGQPIQLLTLTVDKGLRSDSSQFVLEPFDQVFVRTLPQYDAQKLVTITGEVMYPGAYAIRDRKERVSDLIGRAGGLRPTAFLPAIRLSRKGVPVAVDFRRILVNPDDHTNLLLQDGDSLVIPPVIQTLRIAGEVMKPTVVAFDPGISFKAYIDRAGGFSRQAFRRFTYAVGSNGQIVRTRSWLGIRRYPRPEPGMEIVVPGRASDKREKLTTGERIAIFSGITSLTALLLTVVRVWSGN